jgi:iron complex transport system substrate-binding protein
MAPGTSPPWAREQAAMRRDIEWCAARARAWLGLALLLLASPPSVPAVAAVDGWPRQFTDDAGRAFALAAPARRVITLAPALTELVYAVGGADAMLATVRPNDAPAAARALPLVGDALRFDVERILALKPDLVLAWHHGNPERALAQLESLGVPLFRLEPRRLDEIPVALERMGALLGRADVAHVRADALRRDIAELRAAHRDAAPIRVYYQVWAEPLMTLDGRHLVSDEIAACGGRNVFADLAPLVPQISTESVLAADPEVFLTARDAFDAPDGMRRDPQAAEWARWRRFAAVAAVRRGALYVLDGDMVTRPGPRVALGVRAVCAALDAARRDRAAHPR